MFSIKSPLWRLLPYINNKAIYFYSGMFGLLVARLLEAMIPLYIKMAVDIISDVQSQPADIRPAFETSMDLLVYPCLAIVGLVLTQYVITIISRMFIKRLAMHAAYDLRNRVFSHLQFQGHNFYNNFSIGDLMARAISDIALVRDFLDNTTRLTVVLFFTAFVGLSFMFSLSVPLTLAILLPMPLVSLIAYIYSKVIYARSIKVQEGFAGLSTFVQENLNGIRTVQAMAQEGEEVQRFRKVALEFANDNYDLYKANSLLATYMPLLAGICMLIIIGFGSHLVVEGDITLGTLAAFFTYLGMVVWPVREAGSLVTNWQRGASGAERLFEVLDSEPEIEDHPTEQFPEVSGHIELRNLSFRYEGKESDALSDLNFAIKPGETIAVVGRVGSGKSTLLRLLVRLLEPSKGELLLDGHPIDRFPLDKLRDQVCLVLQDPFLFADSLSENIAYDNPQRSEAEIMISAEAAALSETIESLPKRLGTILGERGVNFSGGQKQRTALARGLIRMTPILILDDCFSAVDTATEEHILSGLKKLRQNMTTVLVSHRVSTARHADRIIVLEEGRIVESGSHGDLIRAGGFYAELEQAQSQKGHLIAKLNPKQEGSDNER